LPEEVRQSRRTRCCTALRRKIAKQSGLDTANLFARHHRLMQGAKTIIQIWRVFLIMEGDHEGEAVINDVEVVVEVDSFGVVDRLTAR
jgi:hypothetical protein